MSSDTIAVALFPIPNLVAFPGTTVPLHVFEPRYRRLIRDCVEEERMVGVCHTRKTISEARPAESLEEALSSNQATYQPHEVFSAGACEITETTPDGRILASIHVSQRFSIVEEVQVLPYSIVSCQPLPDEPEEASREEDRALQTLINGRLIELIGAQSPELAREFESAAWTGIEPAEFSFKLFQHVRFDADWMQGVLEATSANERLKLIWEALRRA